MSERPPSFQFYARDFTASAAVRLMSPEARGGYIMLLCQAWMAEEPGVLEDDDLILAGLSELGERWPACKESIRRAFRATSREGRKVLVQPRMVQERERQRIRYEQASKGGRARAEGTRDKLGRLVPEHQDSTSPTPPLASASALESPESNSVLVRRRAARAPAAAADANGFRQGLVEELQARHPSRDVPAIAEKLAIERLAHPGKYRSWDRALTSWVLAAERRDMDRLNGASGNGRGPAWDYDRKAYPDSKRDNPFHPANGQARFRLGPYEGQAMSPEDQAGGYRNWEMEHRR